jgi:hypothetical protein
MIPGNDRLNNWNRLSEKLGCPLFALEVVPNQAYPRFPKDCSTPFALTKWVCDHHPECFPNDREELRESPPEGAGQWTWAATWNGVQDQITSTFKITVNRVTQDAQMVEDFGIE